MQERLRRSLCIFSALLIFLTLAFIWGNSMLDSEASSAVSNGLLERIRPFPEAFGFEVVSDIWLRKLAHFCEFGLLGTELSLFLLLKGASVKKTAVLAAVFAFVTALIDEGIQYFSGRHSQLWDVILDFCGSLCGIAAIFLIYHIFRNRKKKNRNGPDHA